MIAPILPQRKRADSREEARNDFNAMIDEALGHVGDLLDDLKQALQEAEDLCAIDGTGSDEDRYTTVEALIRDVGKIENDIFKLSDW